MTENGRGINEGGDEDERDIHFELKGNSSAFQSIALLCEVKECSYLEKGCTNMEKK